MDSHKQPTESKSYNKEPQVKERLVFSGGGSKGVVYTGAYKALSETGVMGHVKQIAGASAGAMTAALIAINTPVDELAELVQNMSMKQIKGNKVQESGLGKSKWFTSDAKPLLDIMRATINNTIGKYLESLNEDVTPLPPGIS